MLPKGLIERVANVTGDVPKQPIHRSNRVTRTGIVPLHSVKKPPIGRNGESVPNRVSSAESTQQHEDGSWPLAGFAGLTVENSGHRAGTGSARHLSHLPGSLRLHGSPDPAPQPQRVIGMCAWAAVLGLLGLVVAARALWAIMTGLAPGWFEPAAIGSGLAGIGLTVAGFTAIHRRYLPWAMLAAASAALAATTVMMISTL
jgi:hypothetical protein